MKIVFSLAILAFTLTACEGPSKTMGPQQEVVPLEKQTVSLEDGTIIALELSYALYDDTNTIFIEDDRITPTTFQALYFKMTSPGTAEAAYVPVDYMMLFMLSTLYEWNEMQVPFLLIGEGYLAISDTERTLLGYGTTMELGSYDVDLAILVSQ